MGLHTHNSHRHILLLTDRDWTHPQGGGTGTNLYGQIARWLAWGHRVTVIAGAYEGCERVSHPSDRLTIHRMGTRLTVFPLAARATRRGLGADADVCLEVINGISFFTALWWWLKMPRVALVHHVHQEMYVEELGLRGRLAGMLLERLPLRLFYPETPMMTISESARDDLVALGVAKDQIHVSYLGVEPTAFHQHEPAARPTLLYLGRLKAYKRLEVLLDCLDSAPEAVLEIAGDGDHRAELEAEIDRRGLRDRVILHGFVSEDEKWDLYRRAWVHLTASSAEGWGLTVMEAAACGTPSVALRTGGITESVVDGETGLLADTPAELAAAVQRLVTHPEMLHTLGRKAEARARTFTWDRTAQENMTLLEDTIEKGYAPFTGALKASQTGKAVGLAAATMANNVIQLVFTVVFTRLLGAGGYGQLAALVSAFLILLVGGQSLQVAAAREAAVGSLGDDGHLRATVEHWTRQILLLSAVVAGLSFALRQPLAHLIGVPTHPWAAASVPIAGCLWLLLCVQRGVLQGLHQFAPVGKSIIMEGAGRLFFGLILLAAGLGVAGAFLGTPLAFVASSLWLGWLIHRRLAPEDAHPEPVKRTLRSLISGGWVPIVALYLLAALQNVDVIVANHTLSDDAAGSYAAAAVAAKAVVWVAIGIGLHLLPEASRRAAAGMDPRPVLIRALGVLACVAIPALLIFLAVPELLLRVAFGPGLTDAAGALPILGLAMTLLALAFLTVQYLIALGQMRFLWVLAVAAVAEPFVLSANAYSITAFAGLVLGVQAITAFSVLILGLRARSRALVAPAPA